MNTEQQSNRRLWNTWAALHPKTDFYSPAEFKQGKSSLKHIELNELGPVAGKKLLHLQCHFGQDTLSLARMGATATGVDFSQEGIQQARLLAAEMEIPATFVCSEVTALPEVLSDQFDIVFTSYGTICWLPDLKPWAEVVAHFLNPGGVFYIVEFHPVVDMFDDDGQKLEFSYFSEGKPLPFERTHSYAYEGAHEPMTAYVWNHDLGSIITALVQAGLRIEFLHEFPYSAWNCCSFFEEVGPERFVMKDQPRGIPLTFSIRAIRE